MKKSFTLIELLVVIAIIGLLVIIIAIPINRARRGASIARILQYEASLHRYLGADIVGWWQFNEGEGSVAYDISGYSNDGTIHGATYVDGVPGKEGSALEFDGSDYIDISHSESIDLVNNFTVTLWSKRMVLGKTQVLISKYQAISGNRSWILRYSSNDRLEILLSSAVSEGNSYTTIRSNKYFTTPNLWTYIVMVYPGPIVYIDTEKINLTASMTTNLNSNLMPIRIGNYYGASQYFNGLIDDVRIYNRALSSEQINTLYVETKDKYITEEL